MNNKYLLLLQAVEEALGRSLVSTSDFEYLSQQIYENTREQLSCSTLMRLWGRRSPVNPRKSTLDILARYIGYNDSVEFFASMRGEGKDIVTPDETATFVQNRRSMALWIAGILAVLLIAAGLAYLIINKEHEPRRILQINELQNTKQYILKTKNSERGELGVIESQLATTYELAQDHRCLKHGHFAILKYEGDFYLYSVDDARFVNIYGHEVDAPVAPNGLKLILTPQDSCLVISFDYGEHPRTLNVNSHKGIAIDNFGLESGNYDVGNMLEVYEDGDFDPTEPLQRIKQYREEVEKARQALTPEQRYCIYTLVGADGKEGKTRHYLAANGWLTDTLSDSCRFVLHKIDSELLYAIPSFRLCLHEAGKPVPQGCKLGFLFAKNGTENSSKPANHIETIAYEADTFNGQVFFLGENRCFAIRCTSSAVSHWFSGAFWDVKDVDGDGNPDACYSAKRQFVWRVEPL